MIKRALIVCAIATIATVFATGAAHAAEVKVLTSVALTAALNEVTPAFEKATGDKLTIQVATHHAVMESASPGAGHAGRGRCLRTGPRPRTIGFFPRREKASSAPGAEALVQKSAGLLWKSPFSNSIIT